MTETLHHAIQCGGLEIRESPSDDGRTVVGVAVPFNSPTDVGGYTESFSRGAFSRTIAERGPGRVKVLAQHASGANPIGRATVLREDPQGLYAELRISKTQAGDEALELIRDGALDGLSIGFAPVRESQDPKTGVIHRTEVRLHEISIVTFPAYDTARVAHVRNIASPLSELDLARRRAALAAAIAGVSL